MSAMRYDGDRRIAPQKAPNNTLSETRRLDTNVHSDQPSSAFQIHAVIPHSQIGQGQRHPTSREPFGPVKKL